MKHLLSLLIFTLILVGCNSSSENSEDIELVVEDTTRYGTKPYTFPTLTDNAAEIAQTWSVFPEFHEEAISIKNLSLDELKVKTSNILFHTDSLYKKMPDTLYSQAMYSRLVIVDTRAKLLKQVIERDQADFSNIEEQILECNIATANLLTQINEKLEKDDIDNQKIENEKQELEKRKKYFDSIYKAELKDQTQ